MNILLFEGFIGQDIVLYHGSEYELENTLEGEYIYLSTEKEFSENYGENVWEIRVNLGRVFDSTNIEDIEIIYENGFVLTDECIRNKSTADTYFYNLENDCYDTAENFIKGYEAGGNTWEAIEQTEGLIFWITIDHDSILIKEDGVTNYVIKTERIKRANIKKL